MLFMLTVIIKHIMLIVIMLNVSMLSLVKQFGVMLSVHMLNVGYAACGN